MVINMDVQDNGNILVEEENTIYGWKMYDGT